MELDFRIYISLATNCSGSEIDAESFRIGPVSGTQIKRRWHKGFLAPLERRHLMTCIVQSEIGRAIPGVCF